MNRRRFVFIVFVSVVMVVAGFFLSKNLEDIELSDPIRATAPGQFVETTHGKTHYLLEGDPSAPLLVMVHGITVPSFIWDQSAQMMVDAGYRVLRLDLYGRGYSDRPRHYYTREFLADQVADVVESVVPGETYHLMGISLGGAIAADLAVRYPQRVQKLILIAPFSIGFDITPIQYPILGDYLITTILVPNLQKGLKNNFYRPEEHYPDWDERYSFQLRLGGFRRAFGSTLIEFSQYDQLDLYETLGAQDRPILLVWGEEDWVTPYFQHQALLERLPSAQFVSVPEAGHVVHIEAPERVHTEIIEFLRADPKHNLE
jgi:pimeloyl-ACP methyl ester carboxylesterase